MSVYYNSVGEDWFKKNKVEESKEETVNEEVKLPLNSILKMYKVPMLTHSISDGKYWISDDVSSYSGGNANLHYIDKKQAQLASQIVKCKIIP